MIAQKGETHQHRFDQPVELVVVIRNSNGLIVGKDKLKQWKCKCEEVQTYDLERILVS